MSLESRVVSQPSIPSENVFTFPKGIPGFEEYTTFRIFHKDDGKLSKYWLQSCQNPDVKCSLLDPTAYDLNYDLYLDDTEESILKASDPHDIGVFLILKKSLSDKGLGVLSETNGGPLVINVHEHLGIQKLSKQSRQDQSRKNH